MICGLKHFFFGHAKNPWTWWWFNPPKSRTQGMGNISLPGPGIEEREFLTTRKGAHRCEMITPRKINMEPENDGLEDDFPFPGVYSQVLC